MEEMMGSLWTLDRDRSWDLFRKLLLIRGVEEKIVELYPSEELKTPVHLCIGQEACAVGVCGVLSPQDVVYSNHRCHGHYLAKGGDLKALFAELFGRSGGCCRGKGGSMHLCWPEVGFMGSSSIVAGAIPMAAGAAWAIKIRKEPRIAVAFFGDGACDEGVFWETLNFASLKSLPMLFVCEDNLYATNSHVVGRHAGKSISEKIRSFGMDAIRENGNDSGKVWEAAQKAVDHIRAGKGPSFIHLTTYRWLGHVGPKPDWRPSSEVDSWKKQCPVSQWENTQKALGHSEGEITNLRGKIRADIDAAVEWARLSPFPGPDEMLSDVLFKKEVGPGPAFEKSGEGH